MTTDGHSRMLCDMEPKCTRVDAFFNVTKKTIIVQFSKCFKINSCYSRIKRAPFDSNCGNNSDKFEEVSVKENGMWKRH